MFSLIIDTSTERGCVAFLENEKIVFQGSLPQGLNNSKFLIPEIQKGFVALNKSPQTLDFVAVGIGPGSYTGIRVGVMVAKSIVYACKKPLVTFCSLEGFISNNALSYVAIIDAKIGGAYVLKSNDPVPKILKLEALGEYFRDIDVLVTPNKTLIKQKLDQLYPDRSWIWEEKDPDIEHLSKISTNKFLSGEYTDERHVELLYLRKTQAEIEREQLA